LKTFSRKAGGEMGWGRLSEKTKNSNFNISGSEYRTIRQRAQL
jgi:hypothetical protein